MANLYNGVTLIGKLMYVNTATGELTDSKNVAGVNADSFRIGDTELSDALAGDLVTAITETSGISDANKHIKVVGSDLDPSFLGAASLNDLSDVVITSAFDFNVLQFNGTSWVNKSNLVLIAPTDNAIPAQVFMGVGTSPSVYLENVGTGPAISVTTNNNIVSTVNSSAFPFHLKQSATQSQNIVWTLPVDDGFAGAKLTNQGGGVLGWSAGGSAGGVWYSPSTVSEQADGKLVFLSTGTTVQTLPITTSAYAVGITYGYNTDPINPNKVKVVSNDTSIDSDLSSVLKNAAPVDVGDRVFWTGTAFTGDMPTAAGSRVWQVGVVAKSGVSGKIHVEVQLIKVNAA